MGDIVELLKASQYLTVKEEEIGSFCSVVKLVLVDLSQKGKDQLVPTSEPQALVTKHAGVGEVWVHASSGKTLEEWTKTLEGGKRGKPRVKSSSRKIKIALD